MSNLKQLGLPGLKKVRMPLRGSELSFLYTYGFCSELLSVIAMSWSYPKPHTASP
jgi:hypothetical protein